MNKIWEKFQNKRLILTSVLIGLAGTLFLTGLNTVQLKRENREIKARLQREIQQDCRRSFPPSCDCKQ